MGYRRFVGRLVSDAAGKLSALLGVGTRPTHWLTMTDRESGRPRSASVSLYQVDGRTYVIDIHASTAKGWSRRLGVPGKGTLSGGRTDTAVTLTEVSDPGVKRQVVMACAAMRPNVAFASGEDKGRGPAGRAAVVPEVAVFEVKAGQSSWIVGGALLILILLAEPWPLSSPGAGRPAGVSILAGAVREEGKRRPERADRGLPGPGLPSGTGPPRARR